MKCRHILVPSDFYSCSQRALVHASALAQRFQARITLFHVVTLHDADPYNPQNPFPNLEEYYRHLEERAGGQFEQAIAERQNDGVEVGYVVQRGFSPYEEILRFAEDQQVDLIVMGTHGRTALSRFFLGSVAQKIVHHAPCPVMTLRVSNEKTEPAPTYRRLLVPTDFSEQSRKALQLAAEWVENGGMIDLLHVVEYPVHPTFFTADGEVILDISPQLHENAEKLLKGAAEEMPPHIQIVPILLEGSIAKQIIEYGEANGVDLIVMGTHGADALSQILIGSQTNRVIRKAACPVVTVK